MMLRRVLTVAVSASRASTAVRLARAASSAHKPAIVVDVGETPSSRLEEALVDIIFVNYAGTRTKLPARIGETLYDVARKNNYKFMEPGCGGGGSPLDKLHKDGMWYEPTYGEGAYCYFCHVIIPQSHYHLLPPKRPDEVDCLADYPFRRDMTDTSRLACQVTVTKDMQGMVVYVPDAPMNVVS